MTFGLLVAVCYLLGSLPFGLLVARLVRGIDVRRYGSGNTGMTNVLRTLGIWPALLVLALDAGKGILAVALAKAIDPTPSLEVAAALSALMGHIWSPFLGFRGGKGVATGIGALCALSPLTGLIVIVVNLPVVVYLAGTSHWVPYLVRSQRCPQCYFLRYLPHPSPLERLRSSTSSTRP